jgi:hypothetical protein
MNSVINDIKEAKEKSTIVFSEGYFKSSDNKTVMGEIPFRQILFLDYRETEAGSNPREYNGLKHTNLNILKSFLENPNNMFRFLHSGVIVSLVNPNFINDRAIQYDDCCLTNGNQTRFIILIVILLKVMSENQELKIKRQKEFHSFIKKHFDDIEGVRDIIKFVKFSRVNEITNYLLKNRKYLELFNNMNVEGFLNARIRIQINIIDSILPDLGDPIMDTYRTGTLIAEANNDTQNVKVDDIFGTKNRRELNERIFKDFIALFRSQVEIEFRLGEVVNRVQKVHILTLLRLVVATGILCKENDIFKFTNQRSPIYNLFEKLLKKDHVENTIKSVSKIIPLLYKIRVEYAEPYLEEFKRQFIREYKEKAISGNLQNTIIADKINTVLSDDRELEKLLQRNISYNIEHIVPVLVFRIRNLLQEKNNGQLDLTIPKKNRSNFLGHRVSEWVKLCSQTDSRYHEIRVKGTLY